jgi:flavin-binding protein dodecin
VAAAVGPAQFGFAHRHDRRLKRRRAAERVAIAPKRQHHDLHRARHHAARGPNNKHRRKSMADSVYKIIELVGTSSESWEKAAGTAVAMASKSLRDLRIVEVVQLDMVVEKGKVKAYRAKVKVSFKFAK